MLKLNRDMVYNLAILTLGIYPTELRRYIHRILHTGRLIVALFTVVNYWKQSKCPLAIEWANKVWHSHNKILYSNENEQTCYKIKNK